MNFLGAWAPFGGISEQLTHLGLSAHMAEIENATIATTYAEHFRDQAAHLERQRATMVGWYRFLSDEDEVINRNVLRELGHASATMKQSTKTPKNDQTGTGDMGTPQD